MALVPTRQFYPMSFFDSLQTTQVRFFRYGSSITPRKFHFYVSSSNHRQQHYNLSSSSNPEHNNPVKKNNNNNKLVRTEQKNIQYRPDRSLASGNWIEKWNETHQPNRPKPATAVLDYQTCESENEIESRSSSYSNEVSSSSSSTMEKIVEKLKKFGYMDGERIDTKANKPPERAIEKGSVEDIFYAEEGILPNSRGGFSPESPFGLAAGGEEVRFPWERLKEEKNEGEEGLVRRRNTKTSLAELTLPEPELRRLRYLTFQKKHKTRIGGAGVTQEVVNMIHEKWKDSEIIRLQIQGPPALNMKRMHEILERKTGGLVVWRSGTSLSLYRGVSYEVPLLQMNKRLYIRRDSSPIQKPTEKIPEFSSNNKTETSRQKLEPSPEEKEDTEKPKEVQYEDEMNQILDSLGPRFEDWPGADPLPVDADLLPGLVPNFQPPYRILPYGVRRSLGPKEATSLRRLARVLPPHFALGRSRQLQGLSQAIIKLWEKSSIAKVALKRGVQLTTSERMAEELTRLTGGTLLSRNKDFLVFYRGKDFLSPEVTEALEERERLTISLQDEEELARLQASAFFTMPQTEPVPQPNGAAGTLTETLDANAKWGKKMDNRLIEEVKQKAEMARHAELVRKLEKKLAFGERKLLKAERALAKVEGFLQPSDHQADPESITDEERFMFRKLGLRMKAFLLLGRRGVFDGTVENMHLHWKYRELIKIVVNAQTFEQVKKVALALEAESGGVLVSVDRVSKKKFAVIVYRGRDYQRPTMLRPKNLLTKRKALARSIEIQRQQALLNHISTVQSRVDRLRSELEQMEKVKDRGDESLYDTLDLAYPTSDDDNDDEDDEAYVEMYENEDDDEDDKSIELIRNLYEEEDLLGTKTESGFSRQDSFDELEEEVLDNDLEY